MNTKYPKKLFSDILMMFFFILLTELMTTFTLFSLLNLEIQSGIKNIIIAISIINITAMFLAVIKVVQHLKTNVNEIYAMKETGKDIRTTLLNVFDIAFILILCFSILLLTMVVTKGGSSDETLSMTYSINGTLLSFLGISLAVFVWIMPRFSIKELKQLEKSALSAVGNQ